MPELDEQELREYIDEVTRATLDRLIQWKSASASTIYWDKVEEPKARLTLQQISRGTEQTRGRFYILQVFEMPQSGGLVKRQQIDGAKSAPINARLEEIYTFVSNEQLERERQFLKNTLPRRTAQS
jgi:hypothetical protein